MLSFGIRFEKGFDKTNILRLMQSLPSDWDYDFLVLGSSPGGIACAREACSAGKKTAIIKWRKLSPAEEDGYNENLEEIAENLEDERVQTATSTDLLLSSLEKMTKSMKTSIHSSLISSDSSWRIDKSGEKTRRKGTRWRKIRRSRLDLNNELYKRGKEGRKFMLRAATTPNNIEDASNFGWRIYVSVQSLTINWKKMSEVVMDRIMEQNWSLVNSLAKEGIEILEGQFSFVNNHTVRILPLESKEYEVTAGIICVAPSDEYVIPLDIPGATEYGITCDDFLRLSEPPGKTLIVGSTPEGLECAGIVACFRMPAVVVSRSELLKGYDKEMSKMVIANLESKGVVFMEKIALTSIKLTPTSKLFADFVPSEEEEKENVKGQEFDTVVFATGRQTILNFVNIEEIGIKVDFVEHKICTNNEDLTSVPNIYAIGDCVAYRPNSSEISEVVGKLLGKRLFWEMTDTMEYSMIPYMMVTPTEYAFVGLSEDVALYRFGKECIEIFQGIFTPVESISSRPEKQCLVKAIVYKPTNTVIGLHMFGPEAGEVIQGFAAAMKLGMTLSNLLSLVGIAATNAQEVIKMRARQTENANNT